MCPHDIIPDSSLIHHYYLHLPEFVKARQTDPSWHPNWAVLLARDIIQGVAEEEGKKWINKRSVLQVFSTSKV